MGVGCWEACEGVTPLDVCFGKAGKGQKQQIRQTNPTGAKQGSPKSRNQAKGPAGRSDMWIKTCKRARQNIVDKGSA